MARETVWATAEGKVGLQFEGRNHFIDAHAAQELVDKLPDAIRRAEEAKRYSEMARRASLGRPVDGDEEDAAQ